MSDNFYRRLSLIFGFFAIAGIFAMQTVVSNIEIKDLDLWLHIGTGRYIVQHGFQVPGVDFLSSTIQGNPWVNHEWLFQVVVYLIHKFSGPEGLIFMQIILTSVTALLLFLLGYNRKRQFLCILSFLFVSLIFQMRFTIRPDLFSLFFFVVYILILSFFLDRKWAAAVLFVVQVLWTNMHGFFFFGPLFLLIAILGEWLKRHAPLPWEWNTVGRLNNEEYRRLGWLFGFSILACLINPLTFKGAWYPIGVLLQISGDSSIFFDHIMELKKPIQASTMFSLSEYSYYKVLIILSFVSFVFNRWRIDITSFMFWLVFLLFSLVAIRNMAYFAFAAHLVFMANVSSTTLREVLPVKIEDKKLIYAVSLVLKVLVLTWVMQYIIDASAHGYFDFDRYERKSEFGGISQRNFPNKAVDFLVENNIQGNAFNEFNSGAYLVGRCFPNIKVFIDGRTEVYGPAFFKHYLKIVHDEDLDIFQEDLKKYDISIVLINTVRDEGPEKILEFLYDHEDWKLVYLGYDGVVFLKNIPQHHDAIANHTIDLNDWKVDVLNEYRLGSKKVVPYHNINRAYSIEAMGFPEVAVKEAKAALWIYPGYPEAFALIAQVHAEKKEIQKAFHYFRLALTYNSSNREIRANLAKMYELLGMFDQAIDQYEILVERFPKHAESYFLTARAYLKSGRVEEARKYVLLGFDVDHNTARDIMALGDILMENGQYDDAVDMYAIALKGPKRLREVRLKLGDAFEKMGNMKRAQFEWDEALRLSDEDEQKEAVMNRLRKVKSEE